MIETVIPQVVSDGVADRGAIARAVSAFTSAPLLQAIVQSSGTGLTRTMNIQVANQGLKPCYGLFAVLLVMGTAEAGGPAGTQTIATPAQGVLVASLVANSCAIYFTNAAGKLLVDVTQIGAWTTRYTRAIVLGPASGFVPVV